MLILLLMLMSSSAYGQSPCGDDGLCVVQFNAGFNEANKVTWLGELNDCEDKFIDIQIDAAAAGKYKIVVVPTILIFNGVKTHGDHAQFFGSPKTWDTWTYPPYRRTLPLIQISIFLRKCKKGQIPQNGNYPSAIINLQKMIVTVRLKFLGLCQPVDIT